MRFVKGEGVRKLAHEFNLTVIYARSLIKGFAQDLKNKDPRLYLEIEEEIKIPEFKLSSENQIKNSSHEVIPSPTGIYFLIQDKNIVYVGQSTNILSRIGAHLENKKIKFNRYSIIPCKKEDLKILETYYIHKFNTKHNRQRDFRSSIFCHLKDARENSMR